MPAQETLVWQVTSLFKKDDLTLLLQRYNAAPQTLTDKHQLGFWKVDGLTVIYFEKKLLVQGAFADNTYRLLQEISSLDGLTLDDKNAEKFARLFPKKQNAIVCPECRQPSIVIEGMIKGLDVAFRRECGHLDKMRPPLLMLNRRILPDINVLVSKAISGFAALEYFLGFEIVIPDFVMNAIDQFIGSKEKRAISREIANLKALESEEKLTILNYHDGIKLPSDREAFNEDEDNRILEIAHLTNSILITSDKNLKDKASISNRPVVHIPGDILDQVKIIVNVRSP